MVWLHGGRNPDDDARRHAVHTTRPDEFVAAVRPDLQALAGPGRLGLGRG